MDGFRRELVLLSDELNLRFGSEKTLITIEGLLRLDVTVEAEALAALYCSSYFEAALGLDEVEASKHIFEQVRRILRVFMGYQVRIAAGVFFGQCSMHTIRIMRIFARCLRELDEYEHEHPEFEREAFLIENDGCAPEDQRAISSLGGSDDKQFLKFLEAEMAHRREYREKMCSETPQKSGKSRKHCKRSRKHADSELLLSSDTLRQAESELMRKYGQLDDSAQKASGSAEQTAESLAVIEKAIDRASK